LLPREFHIRIAIAVAPIAMTTGCETLDKSDPFLARWSFRGVWMLPASIDGSRAFES
jgi:hypothetical protein